MILEVYACSDVGVQRPKNEDNLYFNGLIKEETGESFQHYEKMNIKKSRAVFGVFDGMGGYAKGEHAAYITADSAKTVLKDNRSGDPEAILKTICINSNKNVCDEINSEPGQKMGATLAMLYFEGSSYYLCNVGDSPIYMMRKGELKKISLEHTEAAAYEKIYGEAPPKDKKFPLTQHIGMSENLARLNPFYHKENIMEGDIFLVCSDGLTDMLDDAEISRIINSSRPLSGIGKILLNNALDRGGKDNITFVLIKATDVAEPKIEIPKRENLNSELKKESKNKAKTKIDIDTNNSKSNKKKNANETERKAIRKIIIGTVIFVIAVAAIAYYQFTSSNSEYQNNSQTSYISEVSDNSVVS